MEDRSDVQLSDLSCVIPSKFNRVQISTDASEYMTKVNFGPGVQRDGGEVPEGFEDSVSDEYIKVVVSDSVEPGGKILDGSGYIDRDVLFQEVHVVCYSFLAMEVLVDKGTPFVLFDIVVERNDIV